MIQENIARILSRIDAVCRKNGRNPKEVTLVAVTKFADTDQIKEAVAAGITHIGENKVQIAREKFPDFKQSNIKVTKHMIGHLQTNKVKPAVEEFDLIQSVDSRKLADAIESHAARTNREVDILIQVNTAGEEQKFGIAPEDVFPLIDDIILMKHIHLKGLMAIAPLTEDKETIRKCFRDLRLLRDGITKRYSENERVSMEYLSMGMTDDYEIALEEGANMVRIGRAIFSEGH